ncbi:MAG: ATP-binding protein [Bacteroidetes bacterium]|nr:ATP-binding protein [Bacteroidota bacterium]
MSEELKNRIQALEAELKVVRLASMQWEEIQRTYQKSNDRLQQVFGELNQVNERLTMAFEASQLAWWDWDFKSGKLDCSENMALLLGLKKESLPTTFSAFLDLIHPEDAYEVKENLERHLNGVTAYFESEYRLKTSSGDWKWVFDKGKIVEKDILGKPLRLLGVTMDVERKKVHEKNLLTEFEKADEANRAKSSFLATMAHEIFTPLSGVVGMAEILKQSELSPEQKEYLGIIEDSATNLLSVFNTIMDFLKIEAGQIELTSSVFSVYELMEDLVTTIIPEAREKELEVLSFVDPNIPLQVKGDLSRLKQVLRVFADNGVKFTENGEITITAHFLSWDEDTVNIQFKVTDTGIGISEEALKRIFTSFTRISPSTGKYGGSGLGLAIARHLIIKMKGEVHVDSTPGKGSSFIFNVLLEKVPGSEPLVIDPKIKGLKVLIIDPSMARAGILLDYMSRMDCEAEHFSNLTDGFQEITHRHEIKKPADLVIVELEAAKLALGSFNSSQPWDEVNKILILYQGTEISGKIVKMGFSSMLKRPFLPAELSESVYNVITHNISLSAAKGDGKPLPRHEARELSILLAEDNLISQKVAKVTLNKLGHHIDVAENGKIAVDLFKKNKYDLIVMDIFMPEQDGLEATREIRQIEQADLSRKAIHICAITANADKDDEEKCYQAGVNSYITKPFKLEELMEMLDGIR